MKTTYALWLLLSLSLFVHTSTSAQFINNGTFDGPLGINEPFNWSSCLGSTTTDIMPGQWNVNIPPFNGDTYLGMVCRGPSGSNANTCEELQQELNTNLQAGECYELSVQLAFSNTFSPSTFQNPIKLNIYLGNTACSRELRIAEFGPIDHTNWQEYTVNFTATDNWSTIYLEADYASLPEYSGHILTDQLIITEQLQPTIELGSDTTLCGSQPLVLNAQNPGSIFLWSTGATEQQIIVQEAGTYWVQVANICGINIDTINVDYRPLPAVTLDEDTLLCGITPLILDAEGFVGDSIIWSTGATESSITVEQSGTYTATVTNGCGSITDAIRVEYQDFPFIVLGRDTVLCESEQLILSLPSSSDVYTWQDGSQADNFVVNTSGIYEATAVNTCGSYTDDIMVDFEICTCDVFIPNVFSPNRDGVNDRFRPLHNCNLLEYEFSVVSRWGDHIFYSEDPEESWDGTFRGRPAATGAYLYRVKYVSYAVPYTEYGTVTIVR